MNSSPGLIAPIHRRDGTRPVQLGFLTSPRSARRAGHELDVAHVMFVTLAAYLDIVGHILERSEVDVEELLNIACRADNPTMMRTHVESIVERLRDQALMLNTIISLRNTAPHCLRRDDVLAWRPLTNLAWDAKRIRSLANVIQRKVAPPPYQRRTRNVGDLHLVFRNAVNGDTEDHFPATLAEASKLAASHRPFNNTAVQLFRVTEIHPDSAVVKEIPIPAADS